MSGGDVSPGAQGAMHDGRDTGQAVIVLGAGQGKRMGGPKLFAAHKGLGFLERILARCRETGSRVILVSDPRHTERLETLLAGMPPRLLAPFPRIVHADGEADMLASVRAALRTGPWEPGGWLWPVDAPFISPDGWRRAVKTVAAEPDWIWKLRVQGKTGHPVWFPSWCAPPILAGSWQDGLRGYLTEVAAQKIRILLLEEEFLADVNTPQELQGVE